MALRDTLRFHRALLAMNLKTAMSNRGAFGVQVAFMILNDAMWFAVWVLFFGRYESIGGFRLADMALLNAVLATSFGFAVLLAAGTRELARMISDGDLDTFLLQPKPALLHVMGSRTQASGAGDVAYGLAMFATFAHLDAGSWLFVPIAVVAGAVAYVAFTLLTHSVAFWAGPFQSLARQLSEILVTISGYPDLLFGGVLRATLFVLLPAGLLTWMPARLVREPSLAHLGIVLGGAVAFATLAVVVFRAGLRRYESGSRFGSMT